MKHRVVDGQTWSIACAYAKSPQEFPRVEIIESLNVKKINKITLVSTWSVRI